MKKYTIYIDKRRCTPSQVERIKRQFRIGTPGENVNGEYTATCETEVDDYMLQQTAIRGFVQIRREITQQHH